ncbi:MAG: winged helix DNA-binding protein [Nanoarchaeota archaeon]|nr:winged helix DNA-binding protein [Nanoarchaeota archaeon]MBU1135012.1 winged helix DNA-binding protein [Nanoarchaeota archaeon]MBU2520059.1 winged helix DNA-binding protein [Nanoarchaeota archaeon]
MLTEMDLKILNILKIRHLITKSELIMQLNREGINGNLANIEKLTDMGYVERVESLGTCLVITQKGMRILEE